MDGGRLLAFAALSLAIIVFPGPSVLFIVSRAVSLGRRSALITVVGNAMGEFLQVGVVAIGMGAVLQRSALIFTVVKLAGAAYLLYLALVTWRHRGRVTADPDRHGGGQRTGRTLLQGAVVGATNPKTMVYFAAVLPEFVQPSLGHVPLQLLLLGLIWLAIALVSDSAWGVLAGAGRAWLGQRPRLLRRAQGASALVMLALGAGLAATSRSS
ncbi:MAG: LysE family translocator [Candidatus Dormibacteria bacterium]